MQSGSPQGDAMASVAFIPAPQREVEMVLPENVMKELEELAHLNNRTVDELFLDAFGLLKIASDAAQNKQKLVVTDSSGKVLKRIDVFP
jgi:hypothetical protein